MPLGNNLEDPVLAELRRLNLPVNPASNILANAPADVPPMLPYMNTNQIASQYGDQRDQAGMDLMDAISKGNLGRVGPTSTAALQSTPPGALSGVIKKRASAAPPRKEVASAHRQ